jgi:hypothetical protein
MGYDAALNKAWQDLKGLNLPAVVSVKFLQDEYSVNIGQHKMLSLSCNIPAKDFTAILILHYLIRSAKGLPNIRGEWLTFREFSGIEGYSDAFKKRAIEPLIRKFVKRKSEDSVTTIEAFPGVPVLLKFWKADSEFGADANIYFDKSIKDIFCTEDIVVLAGLVAGHI